MANIKWLSYYSGRDLCLSVWTMDIQTVDDDTKMFNFNFEKVGVYYSHLLVHTMEKQLCISKWFLSAINILSTIFFIFLFWFLAAARQSDPQPPSRPPKSQETSTMTTNTSTAPKTVTASVGTSNVSLFHNLPYEKIPTFVRTKRLTKHSLDVN